MGSRAVYTDSTQAFFHASGLSPCTLWFLTVDEAIEIDATHEGAIAAWQEVRRRPRPALPSSGFMFARQNARTALQECAARPKAKAQSAPRVPRAWRGLPSGASAGDNSRSDSAKREQAARRALDLVKTWPVGNYATAKSTLETDELRAFEDRFIAAFAAGASVACRVASFLHIERWCAQRQAPLWELGWAHIENYMWSPSRTGRTSAAIARKRFHDLAWLRKYWGFL